MMFGFFKRPTQQPMEVLPATKVVETLPIESPQDTTSLLHFYMLQKSKANYFKVLDFYPELAGHLLEHIDSGRFTGSLYLLDLDGKLIGCFAGLTAYYSGNYKHLSTIVSWIEPAREAVEAAGLDENERRRCESVFTHEVFYSNTTKDNFILQEFRKYLVEWSEQHEKVEVA